MHIIEQCIELTKASIHSPAKAIKNKVDNTITIKSMRKTAHQRNCRSKSMINVKMNRGSPWLHCNIT